MAELTASDVTPNLPLQDIGYAIGRVVAFPSISFGNGVLTYPALGIPMPDKGNFGMRKEIQRVFIEQPANGYVYHYDRTNNKIRIFYGDYSQGSDGPLVEFSGAVPATALNLMVIGQ